MKALIFAAGKGTRLKPFTDSHPKALAEVGGVAMLERVIRRLTAAGVDEAVINVHHFAPQVINFLSAHDNFGITIHISDESDRLLDTGGGLLKARQWLDTADSEPFFVHNADIVTDVSLEAMMKAHRRLGADATLMCTPRPSSRHLYFDSASRRLTGWANIVTRETLPPGFVPGPMMEELSFDGIHVLSAHIFESLQNYSDKIGTESFSIIPFYATMASELDIRAFTPRTGSFEWYDVGTPEKLAKAEAGIAASTKRETLDRRYLRMARIWAENSYCVRRKVGALIVKDKMIISDGYNGTPSGFENICEDESGKTKSYVLHAEANAITKVAKSANNCDGSTLYITDAPCIECSKLIIQAGIRRVVYVNDYRSEEGLDLLRRVGIECVKRTLDQ